MRGPKKARFRLLPTLRRVAATGLGKRWWRCPICGWRGPFLTFNGRPHARCPGCLSLERHRLQCVALSRVWTTLGVPDVLHVAPEEVLAKWLGSVAGRYVAMDLSAAGVAMWADLCHLPLASCSVRLVFASHVLEHVREDRLAISEVYRVLEIGGLAVLSVPIVASSTIEYPAARSEEHGHVRAPGLDYYERYRDAGFQVDLVKSEELGPERFQLWLHDGAGSCRQDIVPMCWRRDA
jgi:SAM-dependent methyltransferase